MEPVIYLDRFYKLIFAGGITNWLMFFCKTFIISDFARFWLISLSLTACINRTSGQDNTSVGKTEADIKSEIIVPIKNKQIIDLQFVNNRRYEFRRGRVVEEVKYYALGVHGEYFFASGEWENEYMLRLIAVSEEGAKFVKDWLGYEGDKLISFVFGNRQYDPPTNPSSLIQRLRNGGSGYYDDVFVNVSEELMPALIIHEIVHPVLRMKELSSNFPYPNETARRAYFQLFEEGLANVIDYLFFLKTDHIYGASFCGSGRGYGIDKQAAVGILHRFAIDLFRRFNNFEDEALFGVKYQQLMTYETAASFIYFLLEYKGTKEDFMRVFVDINLMEEIYGKSMDDMIAEWLLYLEQYK